MAVINTNVKALFSQAALKGTERAQAKAMAQLSTGKRINSAGDDAAGMAIATRMTQQIRSLNQAVRNAGDALSLIQTVEGATGSITDMMQRMRELAVQAVNDTNANDQRSYLDLEFQQLKQEIVRVADTTTWNDFPVLNGSAGERVGEMPVYKMTSVSNFGAVFIDPTTLRTIAGADAGEQQTVTFAAPPTSSGGTFTLDGVAVKIDPADVGAGNMSTFLDHMKSEMEKNPRFDNTSGRSIVVDAAASTLTITYAASDGNVDTAIADGGATGVTFSDPIKPVISTREALLKADENFVGSGNGKFLTSGALSMTISDAGVVDASFKASDGKLTSMVGVLDAANGTITFSVDSSVNKNVISGDIVYSLKDSNNNQADLTTGAVGAGVNRAVSLVVDVMGSIPPLQSGDLIINGKPIPPTYPEDDLLSPVNNAAGSAIAKAAAINRMSAATGVVAKVNENIMTGIAMTGTSVVTGTVYINGLASANIVTSLNNSRETRINVANAINAISDRTKIRAIDTGSDAQGITLVAADGRNIELRFDTPFNADIFGDRTGLRDGVHSGTYSLESKVDAPVVLSSSDTGSIAHAGLVSGDFSKNQAVFNTAARAIVQPAISQVNSVTILAPAGGLVATDRFSVTINGKKFSTATAADSASPQAARAALIALINDPDTGAPGVTASAGKTQGELSLTADVPGTPFTLEAATSSGAAGFITAVNDVPNSLAQFKPLNMGDLVINGVNIRSTTSADDTKSDTTSSSSDRSASGIAIAKAINSQTAQTGAHAEANEVVAKGTRTSTMLPAAVNGKNTHSLFVNGIEIKIPFVQNESRADRCNKVVEAINLEAGRHGVKAEFNGTGVTLTSAGRNLSTWFDSDVEGISAASFGLDSGGAVAQVSRLTVGGAVPAVGNSITVNINGTDVTATGATTTVGLAAVMQTSIEAAGLKNISVSVDPEDSKSLLITSKIPGSPFTLGAATVSPATLTLNLATKTPNDFGNTDVTAIRGATATSAGARTLYGTVRLISDPALLPKLPSPSGAPSPANLAKSLSNGEAFTVASGTRGYTADANFSALGFQQGTFGGRSSVEMEPPRVGRMAFQVGGSANQLITIDLADFGKKGPITGEITGDVDTFLDNMTNRINTRDGATAVLAKLDAAMDKVNGARATMGAVMNRLTYAMDNLTNVSTNTASSRSQIEDADYAAASSELSKTQIMQQAATAVLAQANTSQQTVLKLLQG